MTQLQIAQEKKISPLVREAAKEEGISPEILRKKIAQGLAALPANINHKNIKARAIGEGLRVKINANIGVSMVKSSLKEELLKLKAVQEAGADAIMDLSLGAEVRKIRQKIIANCQVPLGTVPLYEAVIEAGEIEKVNIETYLEVFERHAQDGVDFATVHAGIREEMLPLAAKRTMKCVSRGGSLLLAWMRHHKKNNFLYDHFDKILAIAKKYDVTLSLGDGLRPGCIADATDAAQIAELKVLGKLVQKARQAGVQVMVEGPGHVPLNEIEKNIKLEKRYCHKAPFYVLGPLPTDIAAGYDHIASAIGGALAAMHGADFLCYVTPKEHIGLPNLQDVRDGVIASKIAAHIADIARGNKAALARDLKMAKARYGIDWDEMANQALDKENFLKLRSAECKKNPSLKSKKKYCSMCGPFCAYKTFN